MNTKFKIKFGNFEGPANELIKNIKENTIDINQVPIVEILNNFLEFLLKNRGNVDIDVASETITNAAIILKMKSEQLLPNLKNKNEIEDDEEKDDERILENKDIYLKEYDKYQKIVKYLNQKRYSQDDIFFPFGKNNDEKINIEIQEVDLADLLGALEKVIKNKKREEFIPIKKRTFTVAAKMNEILDILKLNKKGMSFDYFMETAQTKVEIIVIFLALLELIYFKKIVCRQNENFGKIIFYLKGDALNLKKN